MLIVSWVSQGPFKNKVKKNINLYVYLNTAQKNILLCSFSPSYLQFPSLIARIPVQFYFSDLLIGLASVFVTMWDTSCPDPDVSP